MTKDHNNIMRLLLASLLVPFALSVQAAPAAQGADGLVVQARAAASHDQHHEAIDLFSKAIEKKPALRSTVSIELGHQYTWAELPDSAIQWYEVYLLHHPEDLDAKLGVARAMSWAGRLDEADTYYKNLLAESGGRRDEVLVGMARVKTWQEDFAQAQALYDEVLQNDPDHTEARLGLARVTNWSDRNRDAAKMYEDIFEDEPDNVDARQGLAWAQHWSGRTDLALQTLEEAAGNPGIDQTMAELRKTRRVSGSTDLFYRDESDDGTILMAGSSITYYPDTQTQHQLRYGHGRLERNNFPDITRDEVMFSLRHQFTSALAVTVVPGVQWNRFDPVIVGGETFEDFNLFVGDGYVTITPKDWIRIDTGVSRESVNIPLTVIKRVSVITSVIGFDWRWHRRVKSYSHLRYADFSDSNARFSLSHRVDWTPPLRLPYHKNHFVVSYGVEHFKFKRDLDNGYYDPSNYLLLYGGLGFETDIGRRLNFSLSGRLGTEKENGDSQVFVGSFDTVLRYRIGKGVVASAGFAYSGSRIDTPGGFEAHQVIFAIEYPLSR